MGCRPSFLRRPFDGFLRDPAEMFLQRVQQHERRAALHGIMRDQLVNLGFKLLER